MLWIILFLLVLPFASPKAFWSVVCWLIALFLLLNLEYLVAVIAIIVLIVMFSKMIEEDDKDL